MEKKTYLASCVKNIRLRGGILGEYQETVRDRSIPLQWEILNDRVEGVEKSGAVENFRIAAGESDAQYYGTCFQDSDVGKWLEAAACLLGWDNDGNLEKKVDDLVELLGRAQGRDGYLNTYFTVVDPEGRFGNIRECDELYCFGHLAEAAVAYSEATGKKRFLEIMCRYADLICDTFGNAEGQIRACDGHPEAELAFVRLYEATGCRRYLDQAGFQLETRGSEPYYYDLEWIRRGCKSFHPHLQGERPSDDKKYDQSECPVRELAGPVGHAVKTGYLLAGMAGWCLHTGDEEMFEACRRVFHTMTSRQMYITGAIGATRHKEAFTGDYHLPNDRAYAETCASAALVFAVRRMLLVEADASYADVMERVIYNALPAGMSLEGDRYFYVNPQEVYPPDLKVDHDYDEVRPVRQRWFRCACCPPNLARLIASLGAYLYTFNDEELYINLFAGSEGDLVMNGRRIHIVQETDYPWNGKIRIVLTGASGIRVGIRIPAWCAGAVLRTGEKTEHIPGEGKARYFMVSVKSDSAELNLELDMTPYCVTANPRVKADAGKTAVMRGPVVYCAEEADNGPLLHNLLIDPDAGFTVLPETFHGAPFIQVNGGYRQNETGWGDQLYRRYRTDLCAEKIRLLPYSMWGNRGGDGAPGEMLIWLNIWKKQ